MISPSVLTTGDGPLNIGREAKFVPGYVSIFETYVGLKTVYISKATIKITEMEMFYN